MGKHSKETDHDQQHQNLDLENPESLFSSRICFPSMSRLFSLRCLLVLVLSFAILLSAIFWLFPRRSFSQFDADGIVKLTSSVQAYLKLHKPIFDAISHKERLEHDICQNIGLSNTKVTILSMHQSGLSNSTDVEFAVLPFPTDITISEESLTSMRSFFVKLFAQRLNMNLSTSNFEQPTAFQILKFPGGITIDPLGSESVSGVLEVLFKFTLDNSLSGIQDRLVLLKDQLGLLLHLETHESVHVQFTNEEGSTISPPVTVQGYVVSTMATMRNHLQQRLDHLAQIIQTFRAKNLGLDSSVFGEVKSITFSAYMEGKILDPALVLAQAPTSCFLSLC